MIRARFVRDYGVWHTATHIAALACYACIDACDPATGDVMRSASVPIDLLYRDLTRNPEPSQRDDLARNSCECAMMCCVERLRLDGFEEVEPGEADPEIPPLPETVLA